MRAEELRHECDRLKSEQEHSLRRILDVSPKIHDAVFELRKEVLSSDDFTERTRLLTALNFFQTELNICGMEKNATGFECRACVAECINRQAGRSVGTRYREVAMGGITQILASCTGQLQEQIVYRFSNLQPMENFKIAIVALVLGYFLLCGNR